jgi:Legionella pneumophila major outer membrane protein precursor
MQRVTERRLVGRRGVLLAGASMIALAVACSDVRAQSSQSAPPQGQWSSWSEAGLTGHPATDPALGLPPLGPFANMTPGVGWESALGFDYRQVQCEVTATLLVKAPCWQRWSPYHVFGQFRYGQNNGASDPFNDTNIPISLGTATPSVVNATGSATLNKESHWLVDLGVGRDFGLGSSNIQAQLGVRVAEIVSAASGAGALHGCTGSVNSFPLCTEVNGNFSFQSRSQFLGVGPRVGIDGSQPLGGSWAFEYLGGVAVLFGNRSFNANQSLFATTPTFGGPKLNSVTALSASSLVGIFNLDAQAGISYWLTHNFKLTASYRFDGYFNAITIIEANGGLGQQDRFYYGPMLRGTVTFN